MQSFTTEVANGATEKSLDGLAATDFAPIYSLLAQCSFQPRRPCTSSGFHERWRKSQRVRSDAFPRRNDSGIVKLQSYLQNETRC